MFEKLLLAGTITFSLNFFTSINAQPAQPTVAMQATQPAIYIAKVLHDRPLLRHLFQ